jgi:uncharacterized protein (TIGR02147 family)
VKHFFEIENFRSLLSLEFETRKHRRPSYSLRAFERDLGLKTQTLSGVMRRRYGLSRASALKITTHLGYDSKRAAYFIDLVEQEHGRSKVAREQAAQRVQNWRKFGASQELKTEQFHILSRWYFAAVHQYILAMGPKVSAKAISDSFHISIEQVNEAIRVLLNCRLLTESKDGLKPVTEHLEGNSKTPNSIIKAWHSQISELIIEGIQTQPISNRKNLSTIFAFNSEKKEEAREWLTKMHEEFMNRFGVDQKADSVYAVGVHFVEVGKCTNNEM